jgi:prevent-host-death family protein
MAQKYSATKLRANLYKVLDAVLESGVPVEIERNGKMLKIVPVASPDKLANLKPRPDYLAVDPEEIVHVDWSREWRDDLS